ncbi:MAG: arsenate reductase ArsC [Rhodospirillaceae bacterium]|nr:arsenate reductase ArsC [Rhodospirillaceae bacterium]
MQILPSAVLFCCNLNEVRSPMAEGMLKRFHGSRIFVDSAGVTLGGQDPFMIEVMREIGVDMSRHRPKTLGSLETDAFELVIALSPQAKARAEDLTRYTHCEVRTWDIPDPTRAEGNRTARLAAYRQVRDQIRDKILELFPREDD